MIGGLSRTSRVKRVNMDSSLFLFIICPVFSVNCETRKVIIVIRDLPSLIAVNCAHDPPYGPSSNKIMQLDRLSCYGASYQLSIPTDFIATSYKELNRKHQ